MKHDALEPGMLKIFRLYVICSAILIPLIWRSFSPAFGVEGLLKQFITPTTLMLVFLVIYLSFPWWQRRMGRLYLPAAFILLAANIVFGNYLTLHWNVPPASREFAALALILRAWVSIQFLVLFVAWQYQLFWVMLAGVGLSLLDAALYFPFINPSGPLLPIYSMLVIARLSSVAGMGLAFALLMGRQRQHREALAEANRKLIRYAATTEQLAASQERNRLARELHDTLAHSLSGVTVQLEAVQALWEVNLVEARRILDQALRATRQGLTEARRALGSLRASPLEDLGLALAVSDLAKSAAARGNLKLDLQVQDRLENIPPEVEQCVYRVAQEAVTNITRHANARSLRVSLARQDGGLILTVADDGVGFEPASVDGDRYGLKGLRERAEMVGGRLEVDSQPGHGTMVRLAILPA